MLFVELQYTLATEEAERIGVDHVARMSTTDTGEASSGRLLYLSNNLAECCIVMLKTVNISNILKVSQ